MPFGISRVAAILVLCSCALAAADELPAVTPHSENERIMLEMLRSQQQQIRELRSQVEKLTQQAPAAKPVVSQASKNVVPGKTGAAEAAATPPCHEEAGGGSQAPATKAEVEEASSVLQERISQVETRTQDAKVVMTQPGPRIESASGDFSMQVVGAIQADAGGFSQDSGGAATPKLHGGTNIRRLHIGVQGTTFRTFNYVLVFDAAGTGNVTSGVRDAYVAWNGLRPFVLTLGQQKPNVGLEPNFSDRSNASTFMEPGLSATLMTAAGTRNLGAKLSAGAEHWSGSIGIFGDDATNGNVSSALTESWGPAGRVTFAPINSPGRLLHLGASGFWRKVGRATGGTGGNPNFQLRYRAQPEITIDSTRLVDTGTMNFAESVGLVAVEGAGVYGPVSLQGEWAMSRVEQEAGRPSLDFDGGYALASWMITGESRVYDGRTGVFVRFAPAKNFSLQGGGWGAFELATRASFLDLNANPDAWVDNATLGGTRGGSEVDFTLGLNWYLNPWLRLMLDYVHADVRNFTTPAAMGSGADEGGNTDAVAVRVHQEW